MPPASGNTAEFMAVGDRRLHCRWLKPGLPGAPVVFLHEGLGSVDLWRDFPAAVVEESRRSGFVYSRSGNGWSSPLTGPRSTDYMHTEALEVLPEIVEREVGAAPILVGHSDGASIALIYAGSGYPVEGLVLIAPHVIVEPETIESIATVRDRFPTSDMADKMGRYHEDPAATFYGWADVWLSPEFRSWNIEGYLPAVDGPVLLIQGDRDEYGTVEQLDRIERAAPVAVERLMVPGAGHAPHLAQPGMVAAATAAFISALPGSS